MIAVQSPRNYTTNVRCHPVKVEITLNRDLMSTAKVTIPEDEAPNFPMHSFMEIYNQNGSVGVFRVISAIKTIGNNVRLELAHAIDTLSDSLAPIDEDFSGTPVQLIDKIIQYQTTKINGVNCWQRGTVADTATFTTTINYSNLYDLLEEIASDRIDYQFTFDFTTTPWTINFVQRPSVLKSEFRLSRNISECVITRNDAELCTRLYLSVTVETDESITNPETSQRETVTNEETTVRTYDADTISTWGIVQKTDSCTVKSIAEANAYAARFLADHKNPTVTIVIDGAELNRLTGSTFDEHDIGTMCRVALPDYGETYTEHIVTVEYPDAIRTPAKIKVTLANTLKTASQSIAGSAKSANANTTMINSVASSHRQSLIEQLKTEYMLYEAGIAYDAQQVFLFAKAQGILGNSISFVDVTAQGGRTMFSDEFEIGNDGKLYIKRGTGMTWNKNGVRVGVFDQDNLTGGVMVDIINDDTSGKKIGATHVTITGDDITLSATDSVTIRSKITNIDSAVTTIQNAYITQADVRDMLAGTVTVGNLGASTVSAESVSGTFGTFTSCVVSGTELGNYEPHTLSNGSTSVTFLGTGDITFNRAAAVAEGGVINPISWSGADGTITTVGGGSKNISITRNSPTWTTAEDTPGGLVYEIYCDGGTRMTFSALGIIPYNQGKTDANRDVTLSSSWNSNQFIVTNSANSSDVRLNLSATVDIEYNTSTHKYDYTGYAKGGSTARANTGELHTGTQAYDAGVTAGRGQVGMSTLTCTRISGPSGAQVIVGYTLSNGTSNTQQFTI